MDKTGKLDKLALMCVFMYISSSAGTDTERGCNHSQSKPNLVNIFNIKISIVDLNKKSLLFL